MNLFPPLYHAHHASYSDDLTFYLELARQYGHPIVELGCGSGRVLYVLQNAGHDIVGLDNEIEMLRFLQRRGAARVFCADMTSLALAPVFRLAILPCNTYSTFASPQRMALLSRVWRCLQIGGAFAVSFPNPALLQSLPAKVEAELEEIVLHPDTMNPVQIFTSWQRNQDWLSVTWTYDHLFPDGKVERLEYRQTYSLEAVSRFFIEIEQSGFLIRATYGSFDKQPLQRFSPNVIILAEKTAGDSTKEAPLLADHNSTSQFFTGL